MNTYQGFYFRPAKGEQVRTTMYPSTDGRGAICGRVVDAAGAPMEDVLAVLFRTEEGGELSLLGSACTDSAGYFVFGPLESEVLYYIKLYKNDLKLRELEIQA